MNTKKNRPVGADRALKRKARVCSSEAAAISIGIHVLLVIFAGSIVAIKYVQKRDAVFAAENIVRPKLERRELQMPVKVQNLQKKSRRPKVTSRMASVSQSSFALPDMMGLGDIGGGFDRSGGGRSLSSMGAAGSLGFGISGINFFGAKSKGEKMVFIIDAGSDMVTDDKGGYTTYQFAKDRINRMIDGMRSATLFNVMVFTGRTTRMFRPNLVPATPGNRNALKTWFAPVNASPSVVGKIKDLTGEYQPSLTYADSPLRKNEGVTGWIRPVQAAMEQKADNIFVLTDGWGSHTKDLGDVLMEKGFNSSDEWRESIGWTAERIALYKKDKDVFKAKAEKALAEENEAREKAGKPKKFIINWQNYMSQELKFNLPDGPPSILVRFDLHLKPEEIIEHLEQVYKFNYGPQKLGKPKIHMVKLIASDSNKTADAELQTIPKAFRGKFEVLRGAKTMEDLLKYNNVSDEP